MSNKNTDNDNSQQLFSEDITKRLVKKILDDDIDNDEDNDEDLQSKKVDFNIEYETYDEEDQEQYDYDEYDDYDEYYEEKPKRKKQQNKKYIKEKNNEEKIKSNNNYRKNIEIYGKDFFDDDFDDFDDEKNSVSFIGKIISTSIIIVLTISTAFLAFSLKTTKNELEKSKAQVEELLDNKVATENKLMEDSLKSEIESLKQENEMLKNNNPQSIEKQTETTTIKQNTQSTNTTATSNNNNSNSNSNNSSSTEYIVKEGDVIWNISKKVYGNGSHYQKILNANGLKEDSVLNPGQKLIIPSLN